MSSGRSTSSPSSSRVWSHCPTSSADWASLDLPDSASPDKTILVALAKNTALSPRIDVLKKGGLRLRGACPNAIAAYHAFVSTAHYEPDEVTLIMHIGAENTDIAIQQGGQLLFARNVAGGGGLFTEAIMSQFGAPYDRAEKMKIQKVDVYCRMIALAASVLTLATTKHTVIRAKKITHQTAAGRRLQGRPRPLGVCKVCNLPRIMGSRNSPANSDR